MGPLLLRASRLGCRRIEWLIDVRGERRAWRAHHDRVTSAVWPRLPWALRPRDERQDHAEGAAGARLRFDGDEAAMRVQRVMGPARERVR